MFYSFFTAVVCSSLSFYAVVYVALSGHKTCSVYQYDFQIHDKQFLHNPLLQLQDGSLVGEYWALSGRGHRQLVQAGSKT